jgi:NADPH-dependent 2,4-dienoyl-CoA reductase/sulfur reductase-like enzyme
MHSCAPAGDAVEVKDWVTGQQTLIPLAGPANRQGRIAADNIAGRSSTFRGSQGSSVVGLFGLTLAGTGELASCFSCFWND